MKAPLPLQLPTERGTVHLRQLTVEDAPAYFESVDASRDHLSQFGDETAVKYPNLQSVADSIANPSNPDKLRMGIWDGGTFVGSVNLTPQADGSAEVGYWTDGRYLRKGYASLAATAIAAHGAATYPRVFASVLEGNDASAAVLIKSGFRQVARKGAHLIFDRLKIHSPEAERGVLVREPNIEDLDVLTGIVSEWVRNRSDGKVAEGEVREYIEAIDHSIRGLNNRQYVVAEDEAGRVVGVMGLKTPDETVSPYATTERPIEVINAYLDPSAQGKGIGSKLLAVLEQRAAEQGYEELILHSGPRNKHSAWGFWTKKYGEPAAVAERFYETGASAFIWRKPLV